MKSLNRRSFKRGEKKPKKVKPDGYSPLLKDTKVVAGSMIKTKTGTMYAARATHTENNKRSKHL